MPGEAGNERMRAGQEGCALRTRRGEAGEDGLSRCVRAGHAHGVQQRGGHLGEANLVWSVRRRGPRDRGAGDFEGGEDETLDIGGGADDAPLRVQLGGDLLGPQRALGEERAREFLAVGGGAPPRLERRQAGRVVGRGGEGEGQLRPLAAQQGALEDGGHDLFRVGGNRDGYAERGADGAVLAQEHVQDDAVNLVVGAVIGDDPNLPAGLAVAVHAALALLMAGGIPGEVIV
jgi:hypothetical protein